MMHAFDPNCTGDFTLPYPEVKKSADLLEENGPLTLVATPTDSKSNFEPSPGEETLESSTTHDQSRSGPTTDESESGVEDSKEKGGWVKIPAAMTVAKKKTEALWHYTDAGGLIGVIQNNVFWAGSIECLNDTEEYQYGRKIVDKMLPLVMESKHFHPLQKKYIREVVELSDKMIKESTLFVLCASTAANSLAQWRAYGGETPHAIEIDPTENLSIMGDESLNFKTDSVLHEWRHVVYDPTDQYKFVAELLGYVAYSSPTKELDFEENERNRSVASNLMQGLSYCKEPGFHEEHEVRMIFRVPDQKYVKFRASKRGVTPYIEITAAGEGMAWTVIENSRLPLNSIMVGPFTDRMSSGAAIIPLVTKHGYHESLAVTVSNSTYR